MSLKEVTEYSPFSPYLVQRLQLSNGGPADGPFTQVGLSKEGNDLLGPLFSFDYMGSSEFEFGAVPKCLQAVVEIAEKDFVFGTVKISVNKPRLFPSDTEEFGEAWERAPDQIQVPVHFLTPKDYFAPMTKWVQDVDAVEPYSRAKEMTRFMENAYMREWRDRQDMQPDTSYSTCIGWIEIGYGCFYFIDFDVYEKMRNLFGITQKAPTA